MTRAEWGPPRKVGRPRTPLPADTTTTDDLPALTKNQAATSEFKLRLRHGCGELPRQRHDSRYMHGWQAGFRRGRVDALRCAMREVDVLDVLVVLARLADEYELAAGDA